LSPELSAGRRSGAQPYTNKDEKEYQIKVQLPEGGKKDISVRAEAGALTIMGERKLWIYGTNFRKKPFQQWNGFRARNWVLC
jgi:HSP20 family molecular chaperone IbpA